MRKRKRKSGIWHHRVPDYKLVYCGREEDSSEKQIKDNIGKKKSVIFDDNYLNEVGCSSKKLD